MGDQIQCFYEKQSQLMTAVEQNLPIIVSLNHFESTCLLRRLIPFVVSHMDLSANRVSQKSTCLSIFLVISSVNV